MFSQTSLIKSQKILKNFKDHFEIIYVFVAYFSNNFA